MFLHERQIAIARWTKGFVIGAAVLLALLGGIASPNSAGAHAALESSDPAANSVLPDTPPRVTMRFTEPRSG